MFVSELGEFELIDRLESSVRARNDRQVDLLRKLGVHVDVGIGDDAAAWSYPECQVVGTTDAMVENVHFIVDKTPGENSAGRRWLRTSATSAQWDAPLRSPW